MASVLPSSNTDIMGGSGNTYLSRYFSFQLQARRRPIGGFGMDKDVCHRVLVVPKSREA